MKKLGYIFIFLLLVSTQAWATHNRAGEITYKWLGGTTYEITITLYTKTSSCAADRCSVTLFFGDGDSAVVQRTNGPACNTVNYNCQTGSLPDLSCPHCGEEFNSFDVKKNLYAVVHTYPGPGIYVMYMIDPNRNRGIVNVADDVPLELQDSLFLYPPPPNALTRNNSPVLTNPPIDRACLDQIFIHNAGATDPDGDSLAYHLTKCNDDINHPITGYWIPSGVSINNTNGDFIWNVPKQVGEFNFAFIIEEWRWVPELRRRFLISQMRRDMQVTVVPCQNKPPVIKSVEDTCVLANTTLSFNITAQDQSGNNIQSFIATGGPFITNPKANFSVNVPPEKNLATGVFNWNPTCNQVRKAPYSVSFKAVDDGLPDNIILSDYHTLFITVIAPAPKNLLATPKCNAMLLQWDEAECKPTVNYLWQYKIYRKIGCDTNQHNYCETGVPSNWGYQLIATVPYTATSYTDNNGGSGLSAGTNYSYRVVAYYIDGAESYCSNQVCNKLIRDVPIITHVDVTSTSTTNGSIDVKWINPLPDSANFDTTLSQNQGPYTLKLFRNSGLSNPNTLVQTFNSPYFATLPTFYSDNNLNTVSSGYNYKIELYANGTLSCPVQNASSVFASCSSSDNTISLNWNFNVPWTNYNYNVYRKQGASAWTLLATTNSTSYNDGNLPNNVSYCYKIEAYGRYQDTLTIPHPLINWSEELCCAAEDKTPTCPPALSVDSNCTQSENMLSWTNPNKSCADDGMYYIIYHSDSIGGDFIVVDTIADITITTFIHDSLNSIAGCYAVTAIDSFGNESKFSNLICIDNCPNYELPNVFTPNGDNSNDYYTPLHPYKYIYNVDIKIYNRWGVEVFRTSNPEIMWDGKSVQTKLDCSDGVYYYVCIVNEIRLAGIRPRILKGNIHLLRGE